MSFDSEGAGWYPWAIFDWLRRSFASFLVKPDVPATPAHAAGGRVVDQVSLES